METQLVDTTSHEISLLASLTRSWPIFCPCGNSIIWQCQSEFTQMTPSYIFYKSLVVSFAILAAAVGSRHGQSDVVFIICSCCC